MFTKQLIEEIKKKLFVLGKSDSLFEETKDLNRNDFFAVVKDGENKKISINDFVDSDGFSSKLQEVLPERLVIYENCTFYGTGDDITIESDPETGRMRIKNRTLTDGGMGYIILEPNKSFVNQIGLEDTIYEVRYDFTLTDASIDFPANSVLYFNGGSLKNLNGTTNLVGDGAIFSSIVPKDKTLYNVELTGDWIEQEFEVEDGSITLQKLASDVTDEIDSKQDTLVSAVNIKTINGESILGEGDLPVGGTPELNTEDLNLDTAGKIQFANRNNTDGLGYKILRQGDGLTFANQVTDSNTVYEIRYDFEIGSRREIEVSISSSNSSYLETPMWRTEQQKLYILIKVKNSAIATRDALIASGASQEKIDEAQEKVDAAVAAVAAQQLVINSTPQHYLYATVSLPAHKVLVAKNQKCLFLNNSLTADLQKERYIGSTEDGVNTTVYVAYPYEGTYTLVEETFVSLPENCVLRFIGGHLSNGTIVGNNSIIDSASTIEETLNNVTLTGTYKTKESEVKEISCKWKETFEHNLLSNEDFNGNTGWTITNTLIVDNACNVECGFTVDIDTTVDPPTISNGTEHPGYVSQQVNLTPGIYIAACYISIDRIEPFLNPNESGTPKGYDYTDPSTSEDGNMNSLRAFVQADGIGMSIREVLPSGKFFREVDCPYVAICKEMQYVPVLKIFEVRNNITVELKFGCIFGHQGIVKGKIHHAGLYRISNGIDERNFLYKECYSNYKAWIENKRSFSSNVFGVVYPDSECKQAFVDAMNGLAYELGLHNSVFFTPSGTRVIIESYDWYLNYVDSSSSIAGKMYASDGTEINNAEVRSYVFTDVSGSVLNMVSNYRYEGALDFTYPLITYWRAKEGQKDAFVGFDTYSRIKSPTYTFNQSVPHLLKLPSTCNKIIVTTMLNDPAPTLMYGSDVQRSSNPAKSVHIVGDPDEYIDLFRPNDTRMSAKDLAVLGVATFSKDWMARMYAETDRRGTVDGEIEYNPATSFTSSLISSNTRVTYLGWKGGSTPAIHSVSECRLIYDNLFNKKMVIAYMKVPSESAMSPTLVSLISSVRSDGEFPPIDIPYAAGGFIPEYNNYIDVETLRSYHLVGDYLTDFGQIPNGMWHPSSTTKIMTTLAAVENSELADDIIFTLTDTIVGSGRNNYHEGDKVSLRDAIGILLRSSDNTLADSIARCVGEKILIRKDNR